MSSSPSSSPGSFRHRIGCVSFLNSKPLIEPLVGQADIDIHFAVPAELLPMVDAGIVSTALLSVVDYQYAAHDLLLVPAGAIACDGPTLTVRLFSKVPLEKTAALHGDTDSHTSVILAQVILRERFGITPPLLPLHAREGHHQGLHDTMLLIGDKVVNAAPDPRQYPYQLDLGQAWKDLTGLPFVFACWMMRADRVDHDLAERLAWAQREGAGMTERLLDLYAQQKEWPRDLARRYFTEYLRYEITPEGRAGLARFFALAQRHKLLPARRDIRYLELAPV